MTVRPAPPRHVTPVVVPQRVELTEAQLITILTEEVRTVDPWRDRYEPTVVAVLEANDVNYQHVNVSIREGLRTPHIRIVLHGSILDFYVTVPKK